MIVLQPCHLYAQQFAQEINQLQLRQCFGTCGIVFRAAASPHQMVGLPPCCDAHLSIPTSHETLVLFAELTTVLRRRVVARWQEVFKAGVDWMMAVA